MMKMSKNKFLAPDKIRRILNYDESALRDFLIHYSELIKKECIAFSYDKNGVVYKYLNTGKEAKINEKLIYSLKDFKI